MQTKYMPPLLFTIAFALIMFAITGVLNKVLNLNIPEKTLQTVIVAATLIFSYIIFKLFGI